MTFLLLGGAGRTGSRILDRLVARDRPVRPASRSTGFDWDDRSTWREPLSGAQAVYVCFSPDLAFPGVAEMMSELGRFAASAGVERLVLLSGRGEAGARASEDALREGGVPVAVLRCSWFQQNFSEHFLTGPVQRGRLALPAPDVPEAFVDLEDVADAAVAALLWTEPVDGTWELSGPNLLTFTDIAQILQDEIGAAVEFAQVSVPEFVADLASDGVPHEEAEPLARLFTEILDGRNASLTPGVEALLGRTPSSFRNYARRTAATGVWR